MYHCLVLYYSTYVQLWLTWQWINLIDIKLHIVKHHRNGAIKEDQYTRC